MHQQDLAFARLIWDFNLAIDHVEPAEVMLVLGSHDLRVADRAAQLYHQGLAPLIVFSGGFGRLTEETWTRPEAEMFAERATSLGVPASACLIENRSTNTGENVTFSLQLLQATGHSPQSFILIHKPYMLRRAWGTFKHYDFRSQLWMTAPQISFEEYPNEVVSQTDMIHIMVGDLQRVLLYPARGFQVPIAVPVAVVQAYEALVARGYTDHLIKDL